MLTENRIKIFKDFVKNIDNEIGTNKHYPIPIHLQECYKNMGFCKGDFPIAEEISETELSLPMFYGMTDEQIQYVIDTINKFSGENL